MKKICIAICIAMLLVGGCSRKERLYVFGWAYYIPSEVIEQFEKEFNVRVVLDEFDSNESMFAKLQSMSPRQRTYDVVFPSEDFVEIMLKEGMLLQLNHELLPNLANINPVIISMMDYDSNMSYSVPYAYGAGAIIINTDKVPDFEYSWNIFAREDLRGRITLLDDLREVLGAALIHLGYSANTISQSEIDEAVQLIKTQWMPNTLKFDAEAFGKTYATGDAWVVHGWPETVFEEIEGDHELMAATKIIFPSEGFPGYIDNMVILSRSRSPQLAHEFINFIHRPDMYALFLDTFGYPATVNPAAAELATRLPLYNEHDIYGAELKQSLSEHIVMYHRAWFDEIKTGVR